MLNETFRLRFFLIVLCAVFALGTLGFMVLEQVSLLDALYFNVATIATVGYGDIHPATAAGKLLAMAVIITGVGVFLAVIAEMTESMLSKHEKKQRMERLNVPIGLFFSELGTGLLRYFAAMMHRSTALSRALSSATAGQPLIIPPCSSACRTMITWLI